MEIFQKQQVNSVVQFELTQDFTLVHVLANATFVNRSIISPLLKSSISECMDYCIIETLAYFVSFPHGTWRSMS